MKRLLVVTLFALAAVSGCGDEATITTDQTVAALRKAGFHNLVVLSNETAMKRAARELRDPDLARKAVDVDAILPRARSESFLTLQIFAVRHPSVGSAKDAQQSREAFLEGGIPQAVRRLLPKQFKPARIHEVRVCNVVMSSYINRRDTTLKRRFAKATELLRDACG